jgi:hypothetical protein
MPIAIYMDQHVERAITLGLRLRDVDVVTAFDDGAAEMSDSDLLDRASFLGRPLFTRDDDLLAEASRRQRSNQPFSGVIYAHLLRVTVGQCVNDLETIAKAGSPEDLVGEVIFLPL